MTFQHTEAARTSSRRDGAELQALPHVGERREPASDEEREAEIKRLGQVVIDRYKVWAMDGCFAARADADRAVARQRELILGRSPEQVRAMEVERGLA